MAKIERKDGRWVDLSLESPRGDDAETARLFDRAAHIIQEEWAQRNGPKQRDLRWLKRSCYALIAEILDIDREDLFDSRNRRHGRYARGKKGTPNAFQSGLMAIFADDRRALNSRDRERFGKQLRLAYRHYVPPEFLIGFLYQHELSGETDADHVHRSLYDWIIERRSLDLRESEFRGTYPPAIEKAVESRRDERRREEDW